MGLGATLYVNNSVEAVEHYKKAFGVSLGYHIMDDDGKSFFHAALMNGEGKEVFAVSGEPIVDITPESVFRYTTELGLSLGSEEKVRKAFSILSENGRVLSFVSSVPWNKCTARVIDKYDVCWYIHI